MHEKKKKKEKNPPEALTDLHQRVFRTRCSQAHRLEKPDLPSGVSGPTRNVMREVVSLVLCASLTAPYRLLEVTFHHLCPCQH